MTTINNIPRGLPHDEPDQAGLQYRFRPVLDEARQRAPAGTAKQRRPVRVALLEVVGDCRGIMDNPLAIDDDQRVLGDPALLLYVGKVRRSRRRNIPVERRRRNAEPVRDLGDADIGIGQQCPRDVKVVVGELRRPASGVAKATGGGNRHPARIRLRQPILLGKAPRYGFDREPLMRERHPCRSRYNPPGKPEADVLALGEALLQQIPAKRFGKPEEVAMAVAFVDHRRRTRRRWRTYAALIARRRLFLNETCCSKEIPNDAISCRPPAHN